MYTKDQIANIELFTGDVTSEQLKYVDCFVASNIAVFMPVAGACQLAVSLMHTHPSHMVVVSFAEGSSIVTDNFSYRSEGNKSYFLPAEIPHHEVNEVDIPRYVAIMIHPSYWEAQVKAYGVNVADVIRWTVFDNSEVLLQTIKRFMVESKQRRPGCEVVLDALSIEITHDILRSMLGVTAEECFNVSRIEINRCMEYMRQNVSEKLTLSILAAFANMSVPHFTRVFRAETGNSPIDYLIDLRLDIAVRKLLAHDFSIKQIAMDCGFSSPSHFSSAFQKKFKRSPTDYAKNMGSK